jgi:hypothetical protein
MIRESNETTALCKMGVLHTLTNVGFYFGFWFLFIFIYYFMVILWVIILGFYLTNVNVGFYFKWLYHTIFCNTNFGVYMWVFKCVLGFVSADITPPPLPPKQPFWWRNL